MHPLPRTDDSCPGIGVASQRQRWFGLNPSYHIWQSKAFHIFCYSLIYEEIPFQTKLSYYVIIKSILLEPRQKMSKCYKILISYVKRICLQFWNICWTSCHVDFGLIRNESWRLLQEFNWICSHQKKYWAHYTGHFAESACTYHVGIGL